MDDIDQLLANLGSPLGSPKSAPRPTVPPASEGSRPEGSAAVNSIEDLLSGLHETTKRQVRKQLRHSSQNPSIDRPLVAPEAPSVFPASSSSAPALPAELLQQIQTQYEDRDRQLLEQQQAEQIAQQQQEHDRQRRQQQLREQRRAELAKGAQQWLKTLKPNSEEGRWFDEFACNYESRVEAAIDYLEALQEVNSWLKTHPTT